MNGCEGFKDRFYSSSGNGLGGEVERIWIRSDGERHGDGEEGDAGKEES